MHADEVVRGQVDARPDFAPGLGNGPEPLQSARVEDRAVAPPAEDVARAYGQVDHLGPAVALRYEDEGLVPAPVHAGPDAPAGRRAYVHVVQIRVPLVEEAAEAFLEGRERL